MSDGQRNTRILSIVTGVAMLVAMGMLFFYLPQMKGESGQLLDNSFNIFYFHLPIALVAYLAFTVVFLSSAQFLRSGEHRWDVLSASSAQIGVIFAFLVLITGSIWANATWGWYWIWEPRLTTSLALFLVYLAYLLMRQAVDEPEARARLSAVFGIVGFLSVPLSFLSIRLWRSAHPLMFGDATYGGAGGGLEGTSLQLTLVMNFIAFVLLYATLLMYRVHNEQIQEKINTKKRSME
ncbi:MAG: cytochrome c biogenesis protein [Methanosarcinaceae archaeon]|nr:cytochrome c biogenesis protein [Methanosarcinaceae archaeon]